MKRFYRKFFILLLSVMTGYLATLLLPIQLFTNRSWEALSPLHPEWFDYAPFYPNQSLVFRNEQGDTGMSTGAAIEREIIFETDSNGYRNSEIHNQYDIILVGDSFVVGSGLTQSNTLQGVLETQFGKRVYGVAPGNLAALVNMPHLFRPAPKFVIWAMAAESNFSLSEDASQITLSVQKTINNRPQIINNTLISVDRLIRLPVYMRNYLFARTNPNIDDRYVKSDSSDMLFLPFRLTPFVYNAGQMGQTIAHLQSYDELFKTMDIQLIVVPIPDKTTIYFDEIPEDQRPQQTREDRQRITVEAIRQMQANDIAVVDTITLFNDIYESGTDALYQYDDTHWSAYGVEQVATALMDIIEGSRDVE